MFNQRKEDVNGERTAVGIGPCKEFLQLAILSHTKEPEFRKLPLLPSTTAEILKSTDPEMTQIAIESYDSYGKLCVFELLRKGYDIRCFVSAKFGPLMIFLKLWFAFTYPPRRMLTQG